MGKDTRIAFRTTEAFKQRVQTAARKVQLDETTLALKALEAVVEHIEANGGIWFPLEVTPAKPRASRVSAAQSGAGAAAPAEDDVIARRVNEAGPVRYRASSRRRGAGTAEA